MSSRHYEYLYLFYNSRKMRYTVGLAKLDLLKYATRIIKE